MAVEPQSSESREGTEVPVARASAGASSDGAAPRDAGHPEHRRHRTLLTYRCRACEKRFTVARAGVASCPRCGSIDDHDALGRVGGERDGR